MTRAQARPIRTGPESARTPSSTPDGTRTTRPGTAGHGPTRWVVSALLVYHLARFFLVRAQARAAARDRARDAERRASLRAAREGWDGAPSPDGGSADDADGSSTP